MPKPRSIEKAPLESSHNLGLYKSIITFVKV
jgi:hypothetical protein